MEERIKKLIRKLGSRMMFFITLNFYIIVVFAMFNNDAVNVLFNHFNEAKIEYIIYAILLPIITYSFVADVLEERKARKERRKQ